MASTTRADPGIVWRALARGIGTLGLYDLYPGEQGLKVVCTLHHLPLQPYNLVDECGEQIVGGLLLVFAVFFERFPYLFIDDCYELDHAGN